MVEYVAIVIVAALLQYFVFAMLVGKARVQHNVLAPAMTGHPVFERYLRVQQNTLELLIMFIPALLIFAQWVSAEIGAGLGCVYLLGRVLYLRAYVADPGSRSMGFMLSMLPTLILLLWGAVGAIQALL